MDEKSNVGKIDVANSDKPVKIYNLNVMIAKNYLNEMQIRRLERTVSGYFDYIEDLVERENTFTMREFAESINAFLEFRRYDVLKDKGTISRKEAEEKAETEYNKFNKTQRIKSDFDRLLDETKNLKKTDIAIPVMKRKHN